MEVAYQQWKLLISFSFGEKEGGRQDGRIEEQNAHQQ